MQLVSVLYCNTRAQHAGNRDARRRFSLCFRQADVECKVPECRRAGLRTENDSSRDVTDWALLTLHPAVDHNYEMDLP